MPTTRHPLLAMLFVGILAAAATAGAEPRIQLKVPPFQGGTFPNFSSVVLPTAGYNALEIWLEDALAEIQLSTVRVKLNDMPMTPFVAVNPLPGGLRTIVKLGATLSPDYSLHPDGENILTFEASDSSKVTYRARFYLTLDAGATAPRVAAIKKAPSKEVEAPAQKQPPEARFTSTWPIRTHDSTIVLAAEVTDVEGLRRVVIEVNGKDVEEILLENERPIRKKDGFIARGALAGEVTGDSRSLTISIPVRLGKNITVVAIRVENTLGLRTRIDRVITRD